MICNHVFTFANDFRQETLTCKKCGKELEGFDIINHLNILQSQLSEARARLAEYDEKSVVIKFMNEDELPKFINDDVYGAMFNCSHVDGVRLFPYVEDSDERYFLILPKVERHSNG